MTTETRLLRVVDFETTGEPPEADVVEAGFSDVVPAPDGGGWVASRPLERYVRTDRVVDPAARAVHHIPDSVIATGDSWREVRTRLETWGLMPTTTGLIFVAHSAAFEAAFLPGTWLCTLKAARRAWPEAPSHALQYLRYWLPLDLRMPHATVPAHRAGPDAYVGAELLVALLARGISIDDMLAWTALPSLLPHVSFGKHRGKSWSELPLDYLAWILRASDMGEDEKFTARHWLEKRS